MKFNKIYKEHGDGILAYCADDENNKFEVIFIPLNGKVLVIEDGGKDIVVSSPNDCNKEYNIIDFTYLNLKPNDNLLDMFYAKSWNNTL